jgi:DNA-binding HxlR family transcriptional regulator
MAWKGYDQLCGVARAAEVLGERWALLVVRDLLLGPKRYKDLLDGLPGLSTNALAARLRQLEGAGVVVRQVVPRPGNGTVYALTPYGRELEPIVIGLGLWGGKTLDPHASGRPDPALAVLALSRRLASAPPPFPMTVVVDLADLGAVTIHVAGEGEARHTRGGTPAADLVLRTDLATLWDLYDGAHPLEEFERRGAAGATGSASAREHLVRTLAPAPSRASAPAPAGRVDGPRAEQGS